MDIVFSDADPMTTVEITIRDGKNFSVVSELSRTTLSDIATNASCSSRPKRQVTDCAVDTFEEEKLPAAKRYTVVVDRSYKYEPDGGRRLRRHLSSARRHLSSAYSVTEGVAEEDSTAEIVGKITSLGATVEVSR